MKNSTKLALAAVALAAATSAQAYTYGDLLIGFTSGSGNDTIWNVGQSSSLFSGETWQVGAHLGTEWGVVGASSIAGGRHIFASSADPFENGWLQGSQWQLAQANVVTLGGGLAPNGISVGQFRTLDAADVSHSSWFYQTAGNNSSSFQANYFNPNVAADAPAYLFNNVQGLATPDGFFTYNSTSGELTYGVVPEPSVYSLLAGFGLLGMSFRRRFSGV
jgi:hypothetical protein